MYEKSTFEGHDARLLRFPKPTDESFPGGHKMPKNEEYWIAGCLGITEPCSDVCKIKSKVDLIWSQIRSKDQLFGDLDLISDHFSNN